ncbi:MAG: VWA domain-containing protein [Acidobacteriota bacterium]
MRTLMLPVLVCNWVLLAPSAFSQETPGQVDEPGAARFKSEVDQVVLYASVYNKKDQLVSSLTKDDFQVYEDRLLQKVTYFGLDDIPSTIGIVMDKSGSMRSKMDLVNQATQLFLSLNNPGNELFLITFDDEVILEEPFTRDIEDIRDALDNIIVSGGTALYDAIYLAVDQVREGHEPKKAIMVFTDGEDKDSYYNHDELLDKVREADAQVYIVAFLDPDLSDEGGFFGIFKSERDKVVKNIRTVAEYTGGKAFFPEKIGELSGIFQTIAHELRNQYRLAYVSSNPARDGKWREVRVVVNQAKEKGLKVRAKKGYYAKK